MDTTDPFPEPSGPFYPPLVPQPTSTSTNNSAQATGATEGPVPQHNPTSTLVFSFLIVFLGVFGGVLVGGMAWQRWTLARRRRNQEPSQRADEARVRREKPRLWDVHVGDERSTAHRSSWTGIYPLAMTSQRLNATGSDSEKRRSRSGSEPKARTPWRRNVWQFPVDPRTDTDQALGPSPQSKQAAQVAVLILMPSQYPDTYEIDNAMPTSLPDRASEGIPCDYAIGTALVTYNALELDVASPQ